MNDNAPVTGLMVNLAIQMQRHHLGVDVGDRAQRPERPFQITDLQQWRHRLPRSQRIESAARAPPRN
jgi:hypothetical protein